MSVAALEEAPAAKAEDKTGVRVLTSRRVAVVLLNLGGPDSQQAVKPFLFNLFSDRAIIDLPQPWRGMIAKRISSSRERSAKANYAKMGGSSPLLQHTQKQAQALGAELSRRMPNVTFGCFPAMRYWKPLVKDAAEAAKEWGATDAVLLPLYPQFSTTTTASSFAAWKEASELPTASICCYPSTEKFAEAHADAILAAWQKTNSPANPRVLFSAHGVPLKTIAKGDPYQWQVEQTVAAVRAKLPKEWDTRICYQSRVGPMKWLGPTTEEEIQRAGRDKTGVIVSPIAFVSDHVETLVELDIDYAKRAKAAKLPFYLRAPALNAHPRFIEALADLVERAMQAPCMMQSESGGRICPAAHTRCPLTATGDEAKRGTSPHRL